MNSDKDKIYMKVVERKEIHNFLVYDLFIYWYIKKWYNTQIYICRSKYYIDYFSTDGFKRKRYVDHGVLYKQNLWSSSICQIIYLCIRLVYM